MLDRHVALRGLLLRELSREYDQFLTYDAPNKHLDGFFNRHACDARGSWPAAQPSPWRCARCCRPAAAWVGLSSSADANTYALDRETRASFACDSGGVRRSRTAYRPALDDAEFERRIGELLGKAKVAARPRVLRRVRTLDEAIRDAVVDALESTRMGARWNLSAAASRLAIHRSRLRRLVRRFGSSQGASAEDPDEITSAVFVYVRCVCGT